MCSKQNKKCKFCKYFSNTITGINESKTLTKHILCKWTCKFNSKKCNSNEKWNNDKCWCECKNPEEDHLCKEHIYLESCYMYFWK